LTFAINKLAWLLVGSIATATGAGCASGPRLVVMDEAANAIVLAEQTELMTTQPQLLAEAKYHQAQADRAFAQGDSEAAELHGHMALQKIQIADHLDVGLQRRALLVAQRQNGEAPENTEGPASPPKPSTTDTTNPYLEATTRVAKGDGASNITDAASRLHIPHAQGAGESSLAEADAVLHAAEDARSLVIILGREGDNRMAEGDDLLNVARRARASGHFRRSIDKAREALVVFYVIRLVPQTPPESPTAPADARAKRKDAVTASTRKGLATLETARKRIVGQGLDALCPAEAGAFNALTDLAAKAVAASDGQQAENYVAEAKSWVGVCEKTLSRKKELLAKDINHLRAKLEVLRKANTPPKKIAGLKSKLDEVEALMRRGSLVEAQAGLQALTATVTEDATPTSGDDSSGPGDPQRLRDGGPKAIAPSTLIVPPAPDEPTKTSPKVINEAPDAEKDPKKAAPATKADAPAPLKPTSDVKPTADKATPEAEKQGAPTPEAVPVNKAEPEGGETEGKAKPPVPTTPAPEKAKPAPAEPDSEEKPLKP